MATKEKFMPIEYWQKAYLEAEEVAMTIIAAFLAKDPRRAGTICLIYVAPPPT